MKPKDKAEELVLKYLRVDNNTREWFNTYIAKQCALIAVDLRLDGDFIFTSIEYGEDSLEYWQEVKQEIENL
jgi:hypothetical protein